MGANSKGSFFTKLVLCRLQRLKFICYKVRVYLRSSNIHFHFYSFSLPFVLSKININVADLDKEVLEDKIILWSFLLVW